MAEETVSAPVANRYDRMEIAGDPGSIRVGLYRCSQDGPVRCAAGLRASHRCLRPRLPHPDPGASQSDDRDDE